MIHRNLVTVGDYLRFLDALVASGDEATLRRVLPQGGPMDVFVRAGDRWTIAEGARSDEPVVHIDWTSANAWLAWHAETSGQPWRMPGELEWEKASRGVDGRWYPWGDQIDPTWRWLRAPGVDPLDASPYGVAGMGAVVREWCLDSEGAVEDGVVAEPTPGDPEDGALRVVRGGSWLSDARVSRVADRWGSGPSFRHPDFCFRGLRRL